MLRQIAKLVLLATLVLPTVGHALGLGEIRVTSNLGQPLQAEIELTAVRPGELDALQVRLAPVESFERIGLDRPFILTQLRFEVGQDARGRPVIRVTTTESVREPFLNFLVEASWARGRLLREFTVLLDPPVLMPATTTPVQTPTAQRREEAPARREPMQSPTPARMAEGTWLIRRNETLWEIARDTRPEGVTINQQMLAILDANPEAFGGNINTMYAGQVLRLPSRGAVTARSQADATAEVRRQNEAWRAGESVDFRVAEAGPVGDDARLRLRAPGSQPTGSDPAGRDGADDDELESELAATQQELDDERAAREALADRLVELEGETEDLRTQLEVTDDDLAGLADAADEGDMPEVTEPEMESEAEAEPQPTPARQQPMPAEEDPGLLGLLTNPLVLALLVGIPVVGGLAFVAIRRRRAAAEASEALGSDEPYDDDAATQLGATGMGDSEPEPEYDGDATVLGDDAEPAPAPEPEPEPEAPADDDPFAADADTGPVGLDESDPTSEADFHLAYGLYDQAAELMETSYKEHPDRVPYLMKLLEIYFSWGKADEFVKHAREGREKLEAAGEWGNVAILGRQMGGDEALFADGGSMSQTRSDLDLDVAGAGDGDADSGSNDGFDSVFGDDEDEAEAEASAEPEAPAEAEAPADSDAGLEFDLSDFEYEDASATDAGAAPAPEAEGTQAIDMDSLDFGDSDGDATKFNIEPEQSATDADDVSLDMDLDAALSESADDEPVAESADELSLDFDSLLEEDAAGEDDAGGDAPASDSRLDLARAYIDMGDADGARSLLNEVMADGDDNQKREAQELLDLIG